MNLVISGALLALAFVSFLYAIYKHETRMQAIEAKVFKTSGKIKVKKESN
tara:strand:- start:216 stop:365 length:150 start_codon:yes stop_codon:yes gene_type:complete